MVLALLYRELNKAGIDLRQRLQQGQFLTLAEINRLADAARDRMADTTNDDDDDGKSNRSKVIDLKTVRKRLKKVVKEVNAVNVATQASRIRYMADYLEFLAGYIGATQSASLKEKITRESDYAIKALRAQVPPVSKRSKLGAREGLSKEDQDRVLAVVHPDSPENPWERGFVRQRNWIIILMLLATGMRRGELLGLQIPDLEKRLDKINIFRRADAIEDPRLIQPNTKTADRTVELRPGIMRAIRDYINHHRKKIKAARKRPQLIVADDGQPLSLKSIDKIFAQLRQACPDLPVRLTSHVMRHTWNERFSEQADLMGLSEVAEEKARNEQQGWTDNSKSATTYTRRHTSKKGREVTLKLQEQLDVPNS